LRKLQNLNVILDIQMVFVKYKNENQLFIAYLVVYWSIKSIYISKWYEKCGELPISHSFSSDYFHIPTVKKKVF